MITRMAFRKVGSAWVLRPYLHGEQVSLRKLPKALGHSSFKHICIETPALSDRRASRRHRTNKSNSSYTYDSARSVEISSGIVAVKRFRPIILPKAQTSGVGDKLSDTADAHAQSPQLCESKDAGRERPADVIVRDVPRIEQQRFHEMRHRLAYGYRPRCRDMGACTCRFWHQLKSCVWPHHFRPMGKRTDGSAV